MVGYFPQEMDLLLLLGTDLAMSYQFIKDLFVGNFTHLKYNDYEIAHLYGIQNTYSNLSNKRGVSNKCVGGC